MESKLPLVSIVTPSLNSGRFLPQLLACIEGQTYPHIEHVIVDGLSTDGSKKILEKCDRRRHRVIYRKDRSMYQAINRGFASSKGEILAYLNTDDLYFPTTVATIVQLFIARPSTDIIFGDVVSVNIDSSGFILYVFAKHQYALSRIALDKSIGQPSVFFRRRVPERIGPFNDTLRFVADLEYWMRASKLSLRFHKVNKFLSIDCRRRGMLRDRWANALQEELAGIRRHYFHYPEWGKALFERRNYWEDIFINKVLEYTASRRFLESSSSTVLFNQKAYRDARHSLSRKKQPILSIRLPYFSFSGTYLEGLGR